MPMPRREPSRWLDNAWVADKIRFAARRDPAADFFFEDSMTPKQGMYIGVGASVGLVLVIVLVVWFIVSRGNTVGAPTGETAPAVLKKIELKLDLAKLITPPPPEDTGAAAVYLEAVKEMVAIGDDFIAQAKAEPEPSKKPVFKSIIDKLEAAADKGLGKTDLNFESVLPITPGPEWKIRDQLYTLGQLAAKNAMSMRADKNKEAAEKSARAALIFGERLFNNGVFVAYKSAGLGVLSEGLAAFEAHYSERFFPDAEKAAAAKQLYADYRSSTERWNKKEVLVRRIGPLSKPGDLWNLAEHDEDRAWRLDAIMWLGVAKWTEASKGGQRSAIQSYLEKKSLDPDPLVAQRAKAAADFSREDVRTLRPE
jgi:hypothetical protein